jgi:hypothetical protein
MNTVSSKHIQFRFEENNIFTNFNIFNLLTGTNVCANGEQILTVRTPLAVSVPAILNKLIYINNSVKQLEFAVSDRDEEYKAVITINGTENGIRYTLNLSAPGPIWLLEWKLSGLQIDEFLIPALGGQSVSKEMPAGYVLSYKYPFWLNAQFVLGIFDQGGLIIRSMDAQPCLKLVRISKEKNGFAITYGFEAAAPLNSQTFSAEWYVDCFQGQWQNGVDLHREWMEEAFKLKLPNIPQSVRKVNFILEIWGARRDSDVPFHTFQQMIDRLRIWKELHPPENTLLYLPGFAEKGIDSNAPDYNPSPQCGGEKKFKELVAKAHEWGFPVMVHTNVLAMTYTHRLYPEFKKYQVIDAFNREQGWGLDIDGDWLTEPYFAYINPGYSAWGDLMVEILGKLISTYSVDAVFLDQTLLAFNVSQGPNFIKGMANHIKRLQKAFPKVLFAGEGLHEQNVQQFALAQIHGLDSITDIHAREGSVRWRKVHPISSYLFSRYTKYLAHLLTKHPSHYHFQIQEESYSNLGVIPALVLYDNEQKMDIPEVNKMIQRARELIPGN